MPNESGKPQGQDPPEGSQGDSGQPQYATAEQVSEIVNKAISARNRQVDAKLSGFEKTVNEFGGAFEQKLTAKLDEVLAKFSSPTPEGKVDEKGAKAAVTEADADLRRQLAGQQRKLDELTKQNTVAKAEADTNRKAAKDAQLRQTLTEALAGVGIASDRAKHAIAFLVDGQKKVHWSADGEQIVMKDTDGDVELVAAITDWAKTPDAQIYLPPRGTSGSGDQPRGTALKTNSNDPNAQKQALGTALQKLFLE